MTDLLKALAEPTRLKLVTMLLKNPRCVGCLARNLGISEPAVSQHIKVLKKAGLVTGRKKGYFMHYSVNRDALEKLSVYIKELSDTPDQEIQGCHKGNKKCHCHRGEKKNEE